ncbi:YCF48-related protein [Thalassoglobus sp.]|uniref:YCF48-related protein n=1 Tax=Thalassoglobus sp. TaxID=2795869 RepID=UPI003AA88651
MDAKDLNSRVIGTLLFALFLCLPAEGFLNAQELNLNVQSQVSVSPSQDDATLHDVTFVGNETGWAVGEKGAIWKTTNGGRSWTFIHAHPQLQSYTLESVHFLTNRVGWISGGTVSQVGRVHQGIVLATTDGGETWTVQSHNQLPYLRTIQFFDLDRGLAVGERTAKYPSGVMQTSDGGQTWTAIPANKNATWNEAAFFNGENGFVVGDEGAQSTFANGAIIAGGGQIGGLRAIRDISVDSTGSCWMVGDGALMLTSEDRGVSWSLPESRLPKEFGDFFDFSCVAQKGGHVWIAGSPGAVILHSPNGGQNWEVQSTGESAPLKSLHFSDEYHGIAVGMFGRICVTEDGGQTWKTVRGNNRRLAFWALHGHKSRVPLGFLTRWSREAGYRSAVTLTSRRDLGVDSHFARQDRVLLEQAVLVAGGNSAVIDWRLPVSLPGLDRDDDKLLDEWSSLTENRLQQVLLGNLVAQIRTWKPDVILLDEPPKDDAVTKLIHHSLPQAVEQAQDPNMYPEHFKVGLAPWSVKKVVMERAPGLKGSITQDNFEILPHLKTTLDVAEKQASSRLFKESDSTISNRGYEVLYLAAGLELSKGTLFGDLGISKDSDARRDVPSIRSIDYDRLIDEAKHRRTMTAVTQRMIDSPQQGAQLLAQLGEILKPLSDEQAAAQLANLALKYRESGQWKLAEETYSQLIIHYSREPAALDAMLWLVEYSTSAEMNWQRLRTINASNSQLQVDPTIVQANFQKALDVAARNATVAGFENEVRQLDSPLDGNSNPLVPTLGNSPALLNGDTTGANQYEMQLRRWQETAGLIVEDMSAAYPRLFEKDEIQFVVAALMRRRKQARRADEIYGRYLQRLNDDDPWHVAAKGEAYLIRPGAVSPKPVVSCKSTQLAPVLDGRITDLCWSEANEIQLGKEATEADFIGTEQARGGQVQIVERKPIVMFSHDQEYLYIGGTVPKSDEIEYSETEQAGRPRDADLGKHDYITIQFDIDRDYVTYYRFDVDQRGWTREACWDAWGYNPEWFVAAAQDATTWSFEIAIPIQELVASELNVNQTWALGVTRVIPGVGVQSWTNSGGETPLPPRFGFLRFE